MRPEDVWSDSMHGQRKQPKRSEVGHRLTDDYGQLHPDKSKMDSNWILALKAIFSETNLVYCAVFSQLTQLTAGLCDAVRVTIDSRERPQRRSHCSA